MFSRLRCHFCGAKAPHRKTVTEFQCQHCEAVNFLDGKGNIVDTPAHVAAPQPLSHANTNSKPFLSFTRPESERLQHQRSSAFCRTCTQNQHLYNETLANYLPDESHPQYREFERAIPQYKAELEKRYPLVCKKCAPEAQTKIHRADHYGMTDTASKLFERTKARNGRSGIGQRDDAHKKTMRLILNTIGMLLYAGMLLQLAFHAYAILTTLFGTEVESPDFDITTYMTPTIDQCSQQARSLRFSSHCFYLLSDYIPYTLALAICGLLYNPGLAQWYHHTYRMEAVDGQTNYFYIQLVILAIRCMAWWNLSDPQTLSTLDSQQIIAMNAFTVFFVLLTHSVAKRSIVPVRWAMRGKMMPKPTDQDVLGVHAAPAVIHATPKASEKDPFRYLRKPDQTPFDIAKLAPQQNGSSSRSRNQPTPVQQQCTPDYSDDDDPMELDDAAYVQSRFKNPRPNLQPTHTYYNHTNTPPLGLSNMREALGVLDRDIQSQSRSLRDSNASKFSYNPGSSPFYGALPPAPKSLEARLRNPTAAGLRSRDKVEPLLSERKDFMQIMRNGVQPVDLRPKKKEKMELKESSWTLPSDVKETGLEDRFGSNFFSLREVEPEVEDGETSGFWQFFGL